jgi:hypothetical protein
MTVEIIIYSCLSFVSISLAIGYLLKKYVPNAGAGTGTIVDSLTDKRALAIELVIHQETIAAL